MAADPDFCQWRDGLTSFELDGERLYLPTGDIPMDEGQLADMWLRTRSRHRSAQAPTDTSASSEPEA